MQRTAWIFCVAAAMLPLVAPYQVDPKFDQVPPKDRSSWRLSEVHREAKKLGFRRSFHGNDLDPSMDDLKADDQMEVERQLQEIEEMLGRPMHPAERRQVLMDFFAEISMADMNSVEAGRHRCLGELGELKPPA